MAQLKLEYDIVDEFADIASALSAKYPEVFGGVDTTKIRCVAIINKERKDNAKMWEVKAVPMPIRMDCPYAWYVVIFLSDWAEMDEVHRQLFVADIMCSIPFDGEEGKVVRPDLNDYSVMLRTFGVDYMDKPTADLKNLLECDIKWDYKVVAKKSDEE